MKILESDFRKELYKNLTDAGYTKIEAQKIVGKKYSEGLKTDVGSKLQNIIDNINSDNFDIELQETFGGITFSVGELKKLKEILDS